MSKSNSEIEFFISENNIRNYKERRGYLLYLIRNINSKLDFNSQTFFLALYFMDKIFSLEKFTIENENDYILYSLCCLIIASKFNENDPHIPDINSYIKVCSNMTKYQCILNLEDIRKGEVYILNLLQFKLNFYSIYHFIVFFFTHGIILENTLFRIQSTNGNNFSQRKYLEKIYILSRELLDDFIEDENNYEIININDNFIIASVILIFAIEKTLSINLDNEKENIFYNVYKIDPNLENYQKVFNIIQEIYNKKNNIKSPKNRDINVNSTSDKRTVMEFGDENFNTSSKISLSPNYKIYLDNKNYNFNYSNNYNKYIPGYTNNKVMNDNQLNEKREYNDDIQMRKKSVSLNKNDKNSQIYRVIKISTDDNLSNRNLDNYKYLNNKIIEPSQLIRNEYLNNSSNYGRNLSKNLTSKTKSVDNFSKKFFPEDILNKTKAIFDKTNKQNNIREEINFYLKSNDNNNINQTQNTMVINNNININKYIDKSNINEIYAYNNYKYDNLNNYELKNSLKNNIVTQKYGSYGTYYDYGYEPYKNNITVTQGHSFYKAFDYQLKNKYGLYGNYGNYY